MSTNTTYLGLGKAVDADNAKTYLETTLGAALDTLDAHDHSANAKGLPVQRLSSSQAAGDLFYGSSASAISRLAIGNPRQMLAINSGGTAPEWVGGVYKLGELSGSGAQYDFTSIPQTFRHLLLVLYGRSDVVATSEHAVLRFNGVSTSTYYSQRVRINGSTVTGAESLGDSYGIIGLLPGASASATLHATCQILIPYYTQTNKEKLAHGPFACPTGLTTGLLYTGQHYVQWDSTAAISEVTVLPVSGAFTADSLCSLYGLPA